MSVQGREMAESYSAEFYQRRLAGVMRSARTIVPLALRYVQPRSVIDVGCGTGTWLAVFREQGIEDVEGLDGSWVDRAMLHIPAERFRCIDLQQPIHAERSFDLVVSVEVAEHLPASCAETFIASLVKLGPVILFSAAIPFQGGTHHVNEQWPDYWTRRFAQHGYVPIDCLRKRLWDQTDIEVWYRQNVLFFVDHPRLAEYPLLRQERDQGALPLAIVHPEQYLAAVSRRPTPKDFALSEVLQVLPYLTARFVRRQLTRVFWSRAADQKPG